MNSLYFENHFKDTIKFNNFKNAIMRGLGCGFGSKGIPASYLYRTKKR